MGKEALGALGTLKIREGSDSKLLRRKKGRGWIGLGGEEGKIRACLLSEDTGWKVSTPQALLWWRLLGIVVQEESMGLNFVDNEGLMGLSLFPCVFPW